ncbi:MAG: hypothetical protein ACR5K2_00110 [Wolbachia sp.]
MIPNVIAPELIISFSIVAVEIGQFEELYYVGYALVHISVSILLDRFGVKCIMPLCIMLTSLGAVPLVSSNNCNYYIDERVITGIWSSVSVLGLFKRISIYYSEKNLL